jgi:hypothetical protein
MIETKLAKPRIRGLEHALDRVASHPHSTRDIDGLDALPKVHQYDSLLRLRDTKQCLPDDGVVLLRELIGRKRSRPRDVKPGRKNGPPFALPSPARPWLNALCLKIFAGVTVGVPLESFVLTALALRTAKVDLPDAEISQGDAEMARAPR